LNASFLSEDAFGEGAKGRTRGRVRSPEVLGSSISDRPEVGLRYLTVMLYGN